MKMTITIGEPKLLAFELHFFQHVTNFLLVILWFMGYFKYLAKLFNHIFYGLLRLYKRGGGDGE